MNRTIATIILLFSTLIAFSQSPIEKGLTAITKEKAEEYISILAHDSLQGREAGTANGLRAANYLKEELEGMGLKPWRGKYFQPFSGSRYGGTSKENPNMQNILAYIPGEKADEIVIIGAHYDHVGVISNGTNDSIYNGADDNASGTSAVLQVARAFVEAGEKPERTVIFALWDGEEKGLLGSFFFVKDHYSYIPIPLIEATPIKGYINLDMIGRNKNEDAKTHVIAYTSNSKPELAEWIKSDIDDYKLDLAPDFQPSDQLPGGSDHLPFDQKGVPFIFYFTDLHPDYHKASDHADKINYDKVTNISKIAFLNLWKMANEEKHLTNK